MKFSDTGANLKCIDRVTDRHALTRSGLLAGKTSARSLVVVLQQPETVGDLNSCCPLPFIHVTQRENADGRCLQKP